MNKFQVLALLGAAASAKQSNLRSESFCNDASTCLQQGNTASSGSQQLANSLAPTNSIYGVSGIIDTALEIQEKTDPFFAVIGMVSTIVGWFEPSDTQQILDAINALSEQIEDLSEQMSYEFQKVMAAVQQDTCYSAYSGYENIIRNAASKLKDYQENKYGDDSDLYLMDFLDTCENSACDNATWAIMGAISGDPGMFGCDMLSILYNGNVNQGYYIGWQDYVTNQGGYLMSLVQQGIIVQSAYMTLQNNDSDAWHVVQTHYDGLIAQASQRIRDFSSQCYTNWYDNFEQNAYRIAMDNYLRDNEDLSQILAETLQQVHPYMDTFANVYDNITGFNVHYVECYDCVIMLHFQSAKNIVVGTTYYGETGNQESNFTPTLVTASNGQGNFYGDAQEVGQLLWDEFCYEGIHVVERYVDLWECSYLQNPLLSFTTGTSWVITAWGTYETNKCVLSAEQNTRRLKNSINDTIVLAAPM